MRLMHSRNHTMDKYLNSSSNENQTQKNIEAIRRTISGVMKQISLSHSERSRDENMFEEYTSIEEMTVEKERKS